MNNSIEKITRILQPSDDVPVMGISEFQNWYQHYDADIPELELPVDEPERAITDCIDAHLATGVNNIVWSCGRSVVAYHSELENATRQGTHPMKPILDQICPLRTALDYARKKNVGILGRLSMNRHYAPNNPDSPWSGNSSRFTIEHPEYREVSKLGREIPSRLCYAFDEVRRERIDILLEIQRIGVGALVLDFCRQPPLLGYHEALVEPYRQKTGVDPREIHSTRPEDYADWFQYRADVMTGFMRELREAVAQQEKSLGRACPIIARVPDNAPWLMIAHGLDSETWCRDDLVDGLMISHLPTSLEDVRLYPEHAFETARKYGKYAIGTIGSLSLMRSKNNGNTLENTGFYHPKPVYEKLDRQYKAGADAVSIYQSETLCRLDYLKPLFADCGLRDTVADKAENLEDPDREKLFSNNSSPWSLGLDWHARWCHPTIKRGECLSDAISGNAAL